MEHHMSEDETRRLGKDVHVRAHFDQMTRAYLLSVLSDELIEEHRKGDAGHTSEPLARLLAWCLRRPLIEQYAVKAESDGTFRLIRLTGRRGHRPLYVGDQRYATLQEARHGAFLRHISDLTEK
jgi:branched-chain amino acid transport system permease protein